MRLYPQRQARNRLAIELDDNRQIVTVRRNYEPFIGDYTAKRSCKNGRRCPKCTVKLLL